MTEELTRRQMIAHLTLHGWEPWSGLSKGRPTRTTRLVDQSGDKVLWVSEQGVAIIAAAVRSEIVRARRVRRTWKQIVTPKLRMMYERSVKGGT